MNRGSEWRIWDLHFHTPASYDYKDMSVTNEDIVNGLTAAGVSVVAITDHYTIDVPRIKKLQSMGKDKGLSVLPGIEFCSELGGEQAVHFIGIFPETADIDSIWTKIQGKCNLTKADIDSRGGYDKLCCEFVKTCDLILEIGGLVTVHAGKKANTIESIKNNLLIKQELKRNLLSKYRPMLDVGKPEDVANYREKVFPDIKFSLPIIMCSDNHNIKEYCVKEKMWIKANTTFEGLKQVLYEQEDRVKIQAAKPDEKNIYQVIDSVTLSEEGFWSDKIYFNPNLNTIIGGRSTGKSTLLKAIAAKHGHKIDDENNFVKDHLDNISIKWQDGNDQTNREIEYFEQSYMHFIASHEAEMKELVERIIRSKGTNDVLQQYKDTIKDATKTINTEIFTLFQTYNEYVSKNTELNALGKKEGLEQQIEILKNKISDLQKMSELSDEDKSIYDAQAKELKKYQEQIECAERDIMLLEDLRNAPLFDNLFEERYQLSTLSFGLNSSEFLSKFENIKSDTVQKFKDLVEEYINTTKSAKENINSQCGKIKESASYKKGISVIEGNKELNDANTKLEEEGKKLVEINRCLEQRKYLCDKANNLIESITNKHCAIKEAAENVTKKLDITYDGLKITVAIKYNKEGLKQFLEIRLNQRGYERQGYLSNFVDEYDNDNKNNSCNILKQLLTGSVQLKNNYTAPNVAMELLATNWYSLNYELSYEGDSFKQMSEGKRAFVILKLLLDFSDKKCPILIDQPEDSLDNRAIYSELVTYLKKKKIERQIILVTHNSNVVVSADAENVIVANQEGSNSHNKGGMRFQYINGALEQTSPKNKVEKNVLESQGIREHVCEILEGGKDAFEKREKKYGFRR